MSDYWSIVPPGASAACSLSDLGIRVLAVTGTGMPPVRHQNYELPMQPGAGIQGYATRPRNIGMSLGLFGGTSLCEYHDVREAFESLVEHQGEGEAPSPAYLRYTISSSTIEIPVYYRGGMDGMLGPGANEKARVALTAYNPYFRDISETQNELTLNETITTAPVIGRIDYLWSGLGSPALSSGAVTGQNVYCALKASDGRLYIGGDFSLTASENTGFAYRELDGTWTPTPSPMHVVYELFESADGDIWIANTCGPNIFTPSSSTFTQPDGGVDLISGSTGECYAFAVDPFTGHMYVGGKFNKVGSSASVAACGVAVWTGAAWESVGTGCAIQVSGVFGVTHQIVRALTMSPTRELYAGGLFNIVNDGTSQTTACYIAKYDLSTSLWSTVDSACYGADSQVWALDTDAAGRLMVGGQFENIGGVAASNIAMYEGNQFVNIGDADNTCYSVRAVDAGEVWWSGPFQDIGNATVCGLAMWNYSEYVPPAISISTGAGYYIGWDVKSSCDIFLCLTPAADIVATYAASHSFNPGTADVWPTIKITGSGYLHDIVNATLARRMVFDKVFINTGETVTIDLNPGAKNITSDWRGNMLGYLEPGSDFTNFKLKGRTGNKVAITITSSGAEAGASVNYYKQYKSVDGLFS